MYSERLTIRQNIIHQTFEESVSVKISPVKILRCTVSGNTKVKTCCSKVANLKIPVLMKTLGLRTILFIYFDGGPDQRLTYVSVKLSLIALFLNLNLDFLVACRTAPNHSLKTMLKGLCCY